MGMVVWIQEDNRGKGDGGKEDKEDKEEKEDNDREDY